MTRSDWIGVIGVLIGVSALGSVSARAELIAVDTSETVLQVGSVTLGDYQLVPTPGPANLIDGTPDFVVVNDSSGGKLVLSRTDGASFDLDSIIVRLSVSATINGVTIYTSTAGFQEYVVDLKDVTSVTMTPFGSNAPSGSVLQFSAFYDAPHPHDALIWSAATNGSIVSVNTITGATVVVGNAGVTLTDIALDSNGDLWGVTRLGGLYSVDTSTGLASFSSALNAFELNALVSDGVGGLFAANQFGDFYTINTTTGVATLIGNMGVGSAGDLEFANSTLYLSAIPDISDPTAPNELWTVDPATGAATFVGSFGVPNMFGLAFESGVMWGLEGTNVYSIDLATGAATLSSRYFSDEFGPGPSNGASSSNTSIIDNDGDSLSAIVSLADISGNGIPEIGVAMPGSTHVHIRDASTDALINDIDFGNDDALQMFAVPDLDTGGDPEIAILNEQASGQVRVQIRDSVTGGIVSNLFYGLAYEPVAMDLIPDYSGNGFPEIAVLGSEAGTDAVRVQVKDAQSTAFLDNIFLGTQSIAHDLVSVTDTSGNAIPEIGILGVLKASNQVRMQEWDAQSATFQANVWFGNVYQPHSMITMPDINSNGADEIVAVGVDPGTQNIRVQVRDSDTTATLYSIWLGAVNEAVDIKLINDINSDGIPDLAVLLKTPSDTGRVRVQSGLNGSFIRNLFYNVVENPVGLAVMPDYSGNGFEELAALGTSGGVRHVQILDTSSGAQVNRIDFP